MKPRVWCYTGLPMLLFAAALHGQDKPIQWHQFVITPSPTPQCLIRDAPDQDKETGFLPCSVIANLSHDYLRDHDIVIWTPPHYKVGPAGSKFWLSSIATVILGVADTEANQHFLHSPGCLQLDVTCSGNPILGKTRLQAYSVIGGTLLFGIYESRKQRRYQIIREQVGLPQWKTILYSWWLLDAAADGSSIIGLTGSVWRSKHLRPGS